MTGNIGLMAHEKTPEHLAKIGAALRGRKQPPEAIAKRTASRYASDDYGKSHGHAPSGTKSPTYNTWSGMIQRCTNPNNPAYKHYGGRGIAVCERWLIFENFLADMGERPEGLSLDRIDNDGNYEPGNCRWADGETQGRNRRRPEYYDRPSRIPECGHPERPHKAHGMCGSCYARWRLGADERDSRYTKGA